MANENKLTVLSPQERESCIVWDEANKDVQVAVYSPRWIRHLEGKLGLKPDEVDTGTKDGCRFYTIPKSWLRLPQRPRRLKPEQRAKLAKAGAAALVRHRKGSSDNVPAFSKHGNAPSHPAGYTSLSPQWKTPKKRPVS